jgi:excisionase family DNA binding protein
LQRVQECETRVAALKRPEAISPTPDFTGIAADLQGAWDAPGVTMRARQQLVRTLISDIVARYDANSREILLIIHWRGGQHSELRVRKPQSGEHGCRTGDEAIAVIRTMATRWSDEEIAATLNRMNLPTGQGKTWTAHRVGSLRRVRDIHAFKSAEKNGEWLTMREAAAKLGVSHHQIRRVIKEGALAAEQVVPGAPFQIRASDLDDKRVASALARKGRPCRVIPENQTSMFSNT